MLFAPFATAGKAIHAVVDHYATHKHPKVRQWLARCPRRTFHFTPTSASWLNVVEGFVSVSQSVVDLQLTINRFVADTTPTPNPPFGRPIQNASSPNDPKPQ
jgi:hypothetical protein